MIFTSLKRLSSAYGVPSARRVYKQQRECSSGPPQNIDGYALQERRVLFRLRRYQTFSFLIHLCVVDLSSWYETASGNEKFESCRFPCNCKVQSIPLILMIIIAQTFIQQG